MAIKKRYTVMTYIFGNGYEKVHEIEEKDPEAEYILITDDPNLKSDTWQIVQLNASPAITTFGRCYTVRCHPFRFSNTPIVLRVDGSIGIRKSLKPIIDNFEKGDYDRCLMIHPQRDTLIPEYDAWVRYRNHPITQAAKCLKAMERFGYNLNYRGLYQGCFEIQRNNFVNNAINDATFGLLCLMGKPGHIERIDQTVWSFVINHFFSDRLSVLPVSEDIVTNGKYMQWYRHNTDDPIPVQQKTIPPYLFNKPCKVVRF